MQVRGIEKDTQVLVCMSKRNYIVRTRREKLYMLSKRATLLQSTRFYA